MRGLTDVLKALDELFTSILSDMRGMADRDQEVRFVIKRGSLDHKTDLIKSTKGTLFMPTSSRLRVRRFDFARDF